MSYKKFVRKREIIERVRLIGPMEKRNDVLRALWADGFSAIQMSMGPYFNKAMFPKVDPTRFLIETEREAK